MKSGKASVKMLVGLVVASMAVMGLVAYAGSVADRVTQTLSTTLGTATWTNTQKYAALELKRIWIEGDLNINNTVTVSRVTADGTYTQSVGSIVCASYAGSTASFTAAYLKYGDMLKFSSTIVTGGVAMIEYEQQEH